VESENKKASRMTRAKKLDVGMKGIKRMLFVFNTIFLLIGVLLTAIGSTIHAVYSEFELFIDSNYFKPVELLISIGVIVMIISIIGYVGTIKKSTMFVNLYALLLFGVLIFEISLAIIGFVLSSTIYRDITSNMGEVLNDYNNDVNARHSWNFMQERLHCCGVHSPFNWAFQDVNGPSVSLGEYTFTVPHSCCTELKCTEIYGRGCITVLGNYASDSTITITSCAIFVLITQIFGVIFACMLAKAIRKTKTLEEMRRQQNRQMIFDQLVKGQQGKIVTPVLEIPTSTEA